MLPESRGDALNCLIRACSIWLAMAQDPTSANPHCISVAFSFQHLNFRYVPLHAICTSAPCEILACVINGNRAEHLVGVIQIAQLQATRTKICSLVPVLVSRHDFIKLSQNKKPVLRNQLDSDVFGFERKHELDHDWYSHWLLLTEQPGPEGQPVRNSPSIKTTNQHELKPQENQHFQDDRVLPNKRGQRPL